MKIEGLEGRELERELMRRANHAKEESLSKDDVPTYKGQTFGKENFVTEYVGTIGRRTDSPMSFHRLTAWVILSTVVGREPYVNLSYGPVHLNLWGMVLGKSSASRKSTTIKKAYDFVSTACPNLVLPNDMSPEAMWQELGSGRKGLFYRDEYAGFLADTKKEYMRGTREAMAQIYDCPSSYERTLVKRSVVAKDVYVTHITGTTISRFRSEITPLDFESGFAVRFLYAFEDASSPYRKPVGLGSRKFESEDKALIKRLTLINRNCSKAPVRLEPTNSALQAFNDWDGLRSKQMESDPLLCTLYERYQATTWKFAGLYEIQRAKVIKPTMSITVDSVSDAIEETEYWLDHGKGVLDAISSVAPKSRYQKAMDCAKRHSENGKISRSNWLRYSNLNSAGLDAIVNEAKKNGLQEVTESGILYYCLVS